jgi:ubiquinol-cytochrome c reductase cytochrome b subunit
VTDERLKRGLAKSFGVRHSAARRGARWLDGNVGGSGLVRTELRHIFPDHWSFFFGEIALYCFIVLVATGVYLTLFFHASSAQVVYEGSYTPLVGVPVSDAYASTIDLSFDVRAGLVVRQVHHWAALVFVAAIIVHLLRMFFTGAYRRPRRLNWLFGLTLLFLATVNGVFGYSLPDDLLSGTGLRIAYSITESTPLVGPSMASLMFGGDFPSGSVIGRIYPVHILLVPMAIAGVLSAHLGLLWFQRHTQHAGRGGDDRTVVGTPLVPAYALRTLGFLFMVAGVLTLFGGLLQINPVWLYGPYHAWDATTAAQPDWYTGWLEGAVRLTPGWDMRIAGIYIPGLFWPAAILPGVVLGFLFVWPWADAVGANDNEFHNLLVRPSLRPLQTAVGVAFVVFLSVLLVAGGDDVFSVWSGVALSPLLRLMQVLVLVGPLVAVFVTYLVCERTVKREAGDGL